MTQTDVPAGKASRDLNFIYDEVFVQRSYLQHGVALHLGDTVLDIGSNIGLFSLYAAEAVGPTGKVVAVEPLPPLHAAVVANTRAHAAWCRGRAVQPAPIAAVQAGASDGASDSAPFTMYSAASGWSSMMPDEAETEGNMGVFLRAALENPARGGLPRGPLAAAGACLLHWGPTWLYNLVWRWYVRRLLKKKVEVSCPLETVSDLIRDHHLRRVDLLKVDVERAELAVLQGVQPTHWPLVRQVALEVHDRPDGRLSEVLGLLRGPAAFSCVTTEQASSLESSTLWNVWATREF